MVSPPIAARRETNFRNGFVRFGASEVQHDEMELNRSFTGIYDSNLSRLGVLCGKLGLF